MIMLNAILEVAAQAIDLIGLAIVLVGAAKFIVSYVRIEIARLTHRDCTEQVQASRRMLGTYILVALEFLIVSDIIGTVVRSSPESVGYLAAIVVLRTAIGYFLEQELEGQRNEAIDPVDS